jgi:hypothetical protein
MEKNVTKIVYNACYGGFGLSAAAMRRIADIKGWQYLAPDGTSSWDSGWILDEEGEQHSQYDLDGWRTDHALVQAVEELGDAANGFAANLRIIELPAGTKYRIDEYDGQESVYTIDDYDWSIA